MCVCVCVRACVRVRASVPVCVCVRAYTPLPILPQACQFTFVCVCPSVRMRPLCVFSRTLKKKNLYPFLLLLERHTHPPTLSNAAAHVQQIPALIGLHFTISAISLVTKRRSLFCRGSESQHSQRLSVRRPRTSGLTFSTRRVPGVGLPGLSSIQSYRLCQFLRAQTRARGSRLLTDRMGLRVALCCQFHQGIFFIYSYS